MMKIKDAQLALMNEVGGIKPSAIINFDWFVVSARTAIDDAANNYGRIAFPTRNNKIDARLSFNKNSYDIHAIHNTKDENFTVSNIQFDIELLVSNGQPGAGKILSKIRVNQINPVVGLLSIDNDSNSHDISYTFKPSNMRDIQLSDIDRDQVLIESLFKGIEYDVSVEAFKQVFEFDEYLQDFFDILPAPNIMEMLESYKLLPPYAIYTSTLRIGNDNKDYIVVQGQESTSRREFCDCGVPGGIRFEDERDVSDDDNTSGSRNSRTVIVDEYEDITDNLHSDINVGFLLPLWNDEGKYFTILDEMTQSSALVTRVSDKGKKSGIKYGYDIQASCDIANFKPTIARSRIGVWQLSIDLPHVVTGKVWGSKKIGCFTVPFEWSLSEGKIDPYRITLTGKYAIGSNGPILIWVPEVKANLHFRLRPSGVLSFFASFFIRTLDRELIEKTIVEKSEKSIVKLLKPITDAIPTGRFPSIGLSLADEQDGMNGGALFMGVGDVSGITKNNE